MQSGTIAFLLGIVALQQFKELPELSWLPWFCLIFPLGYYFRQRVLININWLVLGFIWAWLNAYWLLAQSLPALVEGKDVRVSGFIATPPVKKDRLWQFEFDIEHARFKGRQIKLPQHVRLNWYGNPPLLQAGDQWLLTVRLKRPHGFMNPGGFDYEQWLFSRGVRATGYVRSRRENHILSSHKLDYPVQRLRQHLQTQIQQYLPDHPMQGVVSALVIGYRDNISPPQWEVFRRTGTNHLVAISGLHIGLVAGLVFVLVRFCWAWLPRMALLLAAPRAAALLAILVAGGYAALAGWSLPTQRALIMLGIVMLAVFSRRFVQTGHGLSLALLLVLLHDPMAVLSPGFWLSFGAVGLILLAIQGRRNGPGWWNKWFRVQWVVGLGLIPLLLLFFQQSSLLSPVANFIAVPVVSLLVVPVLLLGILFANLAEPVGRFLLQTGAQVLEYLNRLLSWLAQVEQGNWISTMPNDFVLLISLLGLAFILFGPVRSSRWLGIVLLFPLIFYQSDRPRHGEAVFTLLDVGQGLAAMVQTRHHSLVFDTGPRFSDKFDTGAAVVIPFLRARGVSRLDMLIVSHGDNDHIGGVDSLLAKIPVEQLYTSAGRLLNNGQGKACSQGQSWQWDGVQFQILHPLAVDFSGKENNQSCVLHVKTGNGAVLVPGDIEREAERQLLQRYRDGLRATILVAPHHGSRTSSGRRFIAAVDPQYVLFPVGYRNRYRFPAAKVVQRYRQAGVMPLDTARHGAISFYLGRSDGGLQPQSHRTQKRRYWHHTIGY